MEEEIGGVEVGENVLDGWKFDGEGHFEGFDDNIQMVSMKFHYIGNILISLALFLSLSLTHSLSLPLFSFSETRK